MIALSYCVQVVLIIRTDCTSSRCPLDDAWASAPDDDDDVDELVLEPALDNGDEDDVEDAIRPVTSTSWPT